ncbi:MAG TPA: hypothetical protein VGQ83_38895 [Polyangia bacterium]
MTRARAWRLGQAAWLAAALLLASCGGARPRPAAGPVPGGRAGAPVAAPAAPAAAAPASSAAGSYAVTYAFTYESSCSRSWDVTTWQGRIGLALDAGGGAVLQVTVASRSVYPGGTNRRPEEACRWAGTYRSDGDRLRVRLAPEPFAPGASPHYACLGDDAPRAPRTLQPLTLTCDPVTVDGFAAVACAGEARLPWIMRNLVAAPGAARGPERFLFGAREELHVTVSDGDALVGRQWGVRRGDR